MNRVGLRKPTVMTGGVARNPAAVKHIEDVLGAPLIIPDNPQIAGALGAALFALDDLRHEGVSRRQADASIEAEIEAGPAPFTPYCKTGPKA